MKEIELIEKRKPREKHFLREDGTFIAKIYSDDIHYKKDGKYEEINNTLIENQKKLLNKSNDYHVQFQKNTTDSLMKIEKDGKYIDFKMSNINESQIKRKQQQSKLVENVEYDNILEGIDIKYTILSNKVKETIVMNNNKYNTLEFNIETNLILSKNSTGIIAQDEKRNIIFNIDNPFMFDSNNIINKNIDYSLIENESQYKIILNLDKQWLNAPERRYPIYIDPTITNTGQSDALQDTYIYPNDTNVDRNSHASLKAGVEKVNGQNIVNRTLLKFDLPEIGTGSEVINAEVMLIGYPSLNGGGGWNSTAKMVEVHRVTEDWNEETANWEQMNDKYDSKIESLFESYRSAMEGTSIDSVLCGFSITNLAKKWYKDISNYGIMLKSVNEEYIDDDYPSYFSKSSGLTPNPQPVFSITYRNQNGLESYMNYKKQFFSEGTACINTYNGNLTTVFDAGRTNSGKFPINLQIIYNTNDVILNKDTGFGKGYKLNYDQTIKMVNINEEEYLEYIDEDGTIHYFKRKPPLPNQEEDLTYYDEDGLGLSVIKTEDKCTMTDHDNTVSIFSKYGDYYRLNEIKDCNNNYIQIQFSNDQKITKIYGNGEENVSITYENDVIKIISPDITVNLIYENNKLIKIERPIGNVNIEYNDKNLISSIADVTSTKIVYDYYSNTPYRVKKVTQYGLNNATGQSFSLEYGFNSTTILKSTGQYETIIFDSKGCIVSQNSLNNTEDINNAYSISQEYGYANDNNMHKILSSSSPIKYIKNILKNTSFETDLKIFSSSSDKIISDFSQECSVLGNRSLKISTLESAQSLEYEINLEKGNHYTFSGYFKTDKSFQIILSYLDNDDNTIVAEQKVEDSSDFTREDVTIYYSENAKSNLKIQLLFPEICTSYVDDIQLEIGEVANHYNILENSDFSDGINDWTFEALKTYDTSVDASQFFKLATFNNGKIKALNVIMQPSLFETKFSKTFQIKGKKGDAYTISFWYKNEGVEPCRQYAGNTVKMFFDPVDGEAEYCVLSSESFNPNDTRWQYFTYRCIAAEDFNSIKLIFEQNTQANNFYITNLSFYKNVTNGVYNYDENGNIVSIADQEDNKKIFNYDADNKLISATSPVGRNFKYEYDAEKPMLIKNAISDSGIVNEIIYDENANPIMTKISKKNNPDLADGLYKIRLKGTDKYLKVKYKDVCVETNPCSQTVWNLQKTDSGNYKLYSAIMTDYYLTSDNNYAKLSLDSNNNLFDLEKNEDGSYVISTSGVDEKKALSADKNDIAEFLDKNGLNQNNCFYFESAEEIFLESRATYSEDGKFLTSYTDENLQKTSYETDSVTGLIKSITNAKGVVTTYKYTNNRNLEEVTTEEKAIKYSYNSSNLISKIKMGNREYNIEYDNFLNHKSLKIGNTITLIEKEYEENNGNLKSMKYGSDIIKYNYDEFNRVNQVVKQDNIFNFKYDNDGNVAKIISNDGTEKFIYDSVKRLCEYRNEDYKSKYSYDADNNVVKKEYILGNNYNILEKVPGLDGVMKLLNINNDSITYEKDSLLRTCTKKINNNFEIKYKYLTFGKKTTCLIESIKNGNDELKYKYDSLNNLTHVYHNGVLTNQYYYNQYNELIKEETYDSLSSSITEYQYDLYGNLLNKTTKDKNSDSILDCKNYEYENSNWTDQLTKYNNQTITYNTIGNPITIGNNINLEWKNGKELSSYNNIDSNTHASYVYNESGIRTKKIVNNIISNYYLEGTKIVYEKTGDNTLYFIRDEDGLVGFKYNNKKYYYLKNVQDDIIGILDENYNKVVEYSYDSWGKILNIIDISEEKIGNINPYRYRSYYYDEESSLYYLNNRYYNPEWGRFLNPDSIIGIGGTHNSYNLYLYANNNPINYNDQNGHFFKKLLKKAKKAIKKVVKTVKKVVKKVVKTAAKVVKTVVKTVVNVASSAMNTLYNISKAATDSFVLSAETGIRVGGDSPAIYDKTFGYELTQENGLRSFTSTSIGAGARGKKFEISGTYSKTSYDPDINPMATMLEMGNGDDVETDVTGEFSFSFFSLAIDQDSIFIGFDFALPDEIPIIGSLRIGLDIDF